MHSILLVFIFCFIKNIYISFDENHYYSYGRIDCYVNFYTNNSCVFLVYITVSLKIFCFPTLLACPVLFCYCCSIYTTKDNDHQLLLSTISASFSVFLLSYLCCNYFVITSVLVLTCYYYYFSFVPIYCY